MKSVCPCRLLVFKKFRGWQNPSKKGESQILLFRKIKLCQLRHFPFVQIDHFPFLIFMKASVSQETPSEMGWTIWDFLLMNAPQFHHKINEKDLLKGLQEYAGELYCVPRGLAQQLRVILKKEKMVKNILERPKHAAFLPFFIPSPSGPVQTRWDASGLCIVYLLLCIL